MVTILTGVCLRVLLVHDILRVVEGWQDRWRSESLGRGVWEEMCGSVHSLFSCCRKCTMMIRCLVMLLDRPNHVPRLCLCWDSCRYVYDSGHFILRYTIKNTIFCQIPELYLQHSHTFQIWHVGPDSCTHLFTSSKFGVEETSLSLAGCNRILQISNIHNRDLCLTVLEPGARSRCWQIQCLAGTGSWLIDGIFWLRSPMADWVRGSLEPLL